jgi:hypothetical protein
MEAIWGAVLACLFVAATLSGYGPKFSSEEKSDKDKSEQSDKDSSKDESDKSGQKDKSTPSKASKKKSDFCVKDCPDAWRLRN